MNIEMTTDSMPVGGIAEIRDVRCKCKFVNHVSIGIADKDVRSDSERVEEKLRQKLDKEE